MTYIIYYLAVNCYSYWQNSIISVFLEYKKHMLLFEGFQDICINGDTLCQ